MNRIHFIGGEKGGVGKSVITRLLAQYYIDHEIPFRVYDADLSHGAMMRYYADYSAPVDISRFDNADSIAENAIESGVTTIVDLAAQTSRSMNHWISETGLLDLAQDIGLQLSFWHVMDDGSDSLQLLYKLFNDFGNKVDYVIARNFGRGKDFSHLHEPELSRRLVEHEVSMIDVPALHAPTMRKIDHISASFWAAANNRDDALGPVLGLLERQRVKTWLHRAYTQFDKIHENVAEIN
jgi:hypothetical protein